MRHTTSGILLTLVFGFLCTQLAAEAQQVEKVPRIGFLATGRGITYLRETFRQGLRELGYIEGQNLLLEWRFAEGRAERIPDLVAELVRLNVDVIVMGGEEQAILAAKQVTSTIPIVMTVCVAPVETGLVASLARPGENITGLSIQAEGGGGKRLELLKEAVPQASRVAVLWNATYAAKALELQDTQTTARALGVTLHTVEVRQAEDFDHAFAAIADARPDALIAFSDILTLRDQKRIVDFAMQHRLPLMSETKEFAETGGLMTYGASLAALFHRAAYYVDRILKGAKPADLPVEQPTKFELVINLKTAKALGITMPPSLLVLADEVIR